MSLYEDILVPERKKMKKQEKQLQKRIDDRKDKGVDCAQLYCMLNSVQDQIEYLNEAEEIVRKN